MPIRASTVDVAPRREASSPTTVTSAFRFTDDDVDAMVREAEAELRAARESNGAGTGGSNGASTPRRTSSDR